LTVLCLHKGGLGTVKILFAFSKSSEHESIISYYMCAIKSFLIAFGDYCTSSPLSGFIEDYYVFI